jgi:thiamine-monophosphate kinase
MSQTTKMDGSSGERELIEKIKGWVPALSPRVKIGIGDDAAVLAPPTGKLLVTVDMMAEGVHFDRTYCQPADLGHKLLAVSLSDIAAMAGNPQYAVVSLAIPAGMADSFLQAFYEGMGELARKFAVDIVGGNLTASLGGLILDLCLMGESATPVARAGARPGHVLAVTGSLGASAIGLLALQRQGREACLRFPGPTSAHLRPEPRVVVGKRIGERAGLVSAMIDVSDGLASETHHLAEQSGVGFHVRESAIPVAADTQEAAAALALDCRKAALEGGEDYELLFTYAPADRSRVEALFHGAETPFTDIGLATAEPGVWLQTAGGNLEKLSPGGWIHRW